MQQSYCFATTAATVFVAVVGVIIDDVIILHFRNVVCSSQYITGLYVFAGTTQYRIRETQRKTSREITPIHQRRMRIVDVFHFYYEFRCTLYTTNRTLMCFFFFFFFLFRLCNAAIRLGNSDYTSSHICHWLHHHIHFTCYQLAIRYSPQYGTAHGDVCSFIAFMSLLLYHQDIIYPLYRVQTVQNIFFYGSLWQCVYDGSKV